MCSLDSFYSRILYCVCLLFNELSLSIRDKKGERDLDENLWESCLFCLGGVQIVFDRGRYFLVSLLIDLYLWVIHDICLCFVFCEVKNLFLFTCIFHTCVYAFVKCFRKDRYILIKTFYLLLATSWLGSLRLEFVM